MTKHFSKWASKQQISHDELVKALQEIKEGHVEASLGGRVYKKRIRFQGKGKSGSGRTIVCYKKEDRIIFIHGFAKNEKSNLTKKEIVGFKEFAQVLLGFSSKKVKEAIKNGDFIEVKS